MGTPPPVCSPPQQASAGGLGGPFCLKRSGSRMVHEHTPCSTRFSMETVGLDERRICPPVALFKNVSLCSKPGNRSLSYTFQIPKTEMPTPAAGSKLRGHEQPQEPPGAPQSPAPPGRMASALPAWLLAKLYDFLFHRSGLKAGTQWLPGTVLPPAGAIHHPPEPEAGAAPPGRSERSWGALHSPTTPWRAPHARLSSGHSRRGQGPVGGTLPAFRAESVRVS